MQQEKRTGVGVLIAAVVAVVAMAASRWFPGGAATAYNVAWTAAACCALAGLLAARRAAGRDMRSLWTWLAAAAVSWLIGQLAWDTFAVIGSPSSPNPADVGWWGFAVLAIVGVVWSPRRRGARLLGSAEALPLVASAMALSFALLWPHITRSELPVLARVSALTYPVLYVSAAVVTLQAIIAGSLSRSRSFGVTCVLIGVVTQAAAFIVWGHQLLDVGYRSGHSLVDPLWVLGLLTIGVGGLAAGRSAAREGSETTRGDRALVLPGAMFVLLIGALIEAQLTAAPLPSRVALSTGLSICGMTLIARGALLARRQRTLLAAEREARAALVEREAQLERLTRQLVDDARRDPLTGLRNRRALAEDLPVVEQQASRRRGSYAVALCDVDHFKAYNDGLGHVAGDEALRAIAAILRSELRGGDVAYRYGGEELLIVFPDAVLLDALNAAERLRRAVAAAALPHPGGIDGVLTISIGVAAGCDDAEALLRGADAALYRAKRDGRDRVRVADADTIATAPSTTSVVEHTATEPGIRRLQSLVAVSRAAIAGDGVVAVLDALAQVIRSELRFATVVANIRLPGGHATRAEVVIGDQEARDALLHTTTPWSEWEAVLRPEFDRRGAVWLPAGSHQWDPGMPIWHPPASTHPAADAWHPEDALLLPLRDTTGEVLAIVAVDEPLSGRRPDDDAIEVLMTVADHGAAVLEQIAHERAALEAAGSEQQLSAVVLLAESLDLRDSGTAHHSQTVGKFTRAIAEELGLPPERVQRLQVAGVLHDLGKLAVPDAVLHKPGPLDDHEWREIRRHPETGARILGHAGLTDIAEWVRAHHERIDGRGYPEGLSGDDIPLEARILAVADAYEAMIADRPYRAGMAPHDAQDELRRNAGTQFDAAVADAFLRTLGAGERAAPGALVPLV